MATPIQLSRDGLYKQHLAFSPDGSKIAFTRQRGRQFAICVADFVEGANGSALGEVKQITPDQPDFAPRFQPTWSPDAKKIAYVNIRLSGTDGQLDIHVMNADGSGDAKIIGTPAFERYPAWSPDGKKIAYGSTVPGESGKSSIFVADADGKNPLRLTNNNSQDEHPSWSPDSRRIAFNSNFEGNQEVYAMDADGKNVTRLTNHPALDIHPSWSPDGKRIAFVSYRDGNKDIFVMDADPDGPVPGGANPINVSKHPALNDDPAWHPDGKRLAFVSNRSGRFEIYLMIL